MKTTDKLAALYQGTRLQDDEWVFGTTEVVSKKLYIEAVERAVRAEQKLDSLRSAWRTIEMYLGATQSQDAVPSVEQTMNPSLDK